VRLRCVGCRAVTSIFGRFAGLGVGPVRVSCPFGFVLACVCVIEQVGGWRGSTIFLVFSALVLGGTVRLKWRGMPYLKFHFLQFAVNCHGGRICAVGILSFISVVFCSGFSWFLSSKLLILTICYRMFLGAPHLEEG